VSYIAQRPPQPKPSHYAAFCAARQIMTLRFGNWVAEARPSAFDVAEEIEATLSVLNQLTRLRETI
jgi:hypothetical protein